MRRGYGPAMRALILLALLPALAHATPPWLEALEGGVARDETGRMALRVAHAHARHGSLDKALAFANQARKAGVHGLRINLVRGDAFLRAEEYADAVREYFEVVAQAPLNAYAQVQLWLALRDAQLPPSLDGDRLRSLLRERGYYMPVAARRPRQRAAADTLIAAGYAALKAGQYKAAVDAFQAAIVQDDTVAAPFRGLGIAHGRLEDGPRSLAAYRIYLAMHLDDSRDRRNIERVVLTAERHRGLKRR